MIIIYDGVNDIFYKRTTEPVILEEESEIKDYQRYLRSPVILYRYLLLPIINSEINISPSQIPQSEKNDSLISNQISSLWEQRMTEFCNLSIKNNFESIVIIQSALYNEKNLYPILKNLFIKKIHTV